MTPERLHALIEAYGADPRRWPEDERAAAEALAASRAGQTQAELAEAARLDALLASHRVAPADDSLYRRIVASAPAAAPARPAGRHGGSWWPGIGLAGAGLAGIITGALVVSLVVQTVPATPHHFGPAASWSYNTTAFGDLSPNWSDE